MNTIANHRRDRAKFFLRTCYQHFVICTFLGLFAIEAIASLNEDRSLATSFRSVAALSRTALLAGVIVGLLVLIFHEQRRWVRRRHHGYLDTEKSGWTYSATAAIVGFLCGVADVLLLTWGWGVVSLTVITIALAISHVRYFLRRVVEALQPDSLPSWADVSALAHVYVTMIAASTLITVSIAIIHSYGDSSTPAFHYAGGVTTGSFVDAFYFSIVVMTTLGFGDITPITLDAKIFVAFQCLISYVMFALMVGVITRGIIHPKARQQGCEKKSRSGHVRLGGGE